MRSWLSGWRMPIRMARWDVRRHRGRSLLIAVLVGLPVVLLTSLVTAALATTLSPRDAAAYLYGRGQAIVSSPLQTPIIASPDRKAFTGGPVNSDGIERRARPIPGWGAGNETAALSELLHGTAHLITTEQTQVTTPTGQVKGVDILGADGRQAALAGRVTLDGGR